MNTSITITPSELSHFLLHTALVRPVFIWGPPGIGKSSLVQKFAEEVGLPCISLLGSQLAPEDLIGVPQIIDGKSRFCPPTMIAREEPYCLFLDELNASSHEVQKAFYSLILEKRIGEYHMPNGSLVIGAGNRAEDNAIVKPMSSALINRMVHVLLKASHRDWLAWAERADIHPWIMDYIKTRPDHLWTKPPKHEAPFSTPRGWHMLSDALKQYDQAVPESVIEILAFGCVSPEHAGQFKSFIKQVRHKYAINDILKGELRWPDKPEDRDMLYFLAQSFRAHLVKELPEEHHKLNHHQKEMVIRAKALLKDLAMISLEMAQMVVTNGDDSRPLPDWLLVEIVRDLPRLAQKR
jgi:dynein-related subfamily AAA family protein